MSNVSVVVKDVKKEWINPLLGTKEELIEKSQGLIKMVARKWWRRVKHMNRCEYDDLYQEASYGFLKAYYDYNYAKVAFNTFAVIKANRCVQIFVDYRMSIVHISPERRRKYGLPMLTVNSLHEPKELGGEVTDDLGIDFLEGPPDDQTSLHVAEFISGLSARDVIILDMIADGYSYREIGEHFGIKHQNIGEKTKALRNKFMFYEKHGRHKRRGEKTE